MRHVRNLLVAATALATAGCGGTGSAAQAGSSAPETLVGEVQLTGSEPAVMVTLRTESGRAVNLVGSLLPELRRLTGAEITVSGVATGGRDFSADSYEIRSIEGQRPLVGVVVERDGGVWLEGDETVRLVEVPARLRGQLGAKVWILGRRMEGGLYPQTYGIIKPPDR